MGNLMSVGLYLSGQQMVTSCDASFKDGDTHILCFFKRLGEYHWLRSAEKAVCAALSATLQLFVKFSSE